MSISTDLRRAPLRLTTGALVINSGISRFTVSDETSATIQHTAARYVPQVERIKPDLFSKLLAAGQVAVGSALLLPIVPSYAAGLGASLLGGSLAAAKWRTHGSRLSTDDLLMAGTGVSLLLDSLTASAHDRRVQKSMAQQQAAPKKAKRSRRLRNPRKK